MFYVSNLGFLCVHRRLDNLHAVHLTSVVFRTIFSAAGGGAAGAGGE